MNCAWTEGFADFFPLAVFNDPVYTFPNRVNINFETPNRTTFNWHDGDDVEGRVAGALWDIYDSSPSFDDGYDVYGEGILNIWDTFERQNDNRFAEYWTEFQVNRSQADISKALSALYQNTIDYLPPPPIFDLSTTEPPQSVPVNQSFRMEFTIDVQGSGENGGVSISFPGLGATHVGPGPCYDSLQGSVSVVSYDTGIDQVTCYDRGDLIPDSSATRIPAAHLLVESDDPAWPAGTSRKLVIDVTPKSSRPFTINYRAWACSALHAGCARFPTPSNSEGSDQQGFDIISRTVNVLTPGSLTVTPPGGFGPQGIEGGPFAPDKKTFTLTNLGETPIDWAASKGQDWLNLSSTGGTLNPDQGTTVIVSLNENANVLDTVVHQDTLFFDNLTNGDGDTSRPVNLTIAAAADLAVTKSGSPDPVLLGSELTYTLGIFNNGPSDATGVILTDQLPADVTFVAASANCDELNLTVTCQFDSLPADAGMDIEIRVIAIAVGTIINTADVSSDVADPNMANNTVSETTTVDPVADLAITKTDFRHWILSGDQLTYAITVTNNGPSTATGLEITDDLPPGATFVSSNPQGPDCQIAGNQVKCGLEPLAPVSSTVVTITIVSTVLGDMINTVSVASNVADPETTNNTATDTTTVRLWPPGDTNRDGRVDKHDLRMVVNNWGVPSDTRADLDEDGFTGIDDLSIAGMHFGI